MWVNLCDAKTGQHRTGGQIRRSSANNNRTTKSNLYYLPPMLLKVPQVKHLDFINYILVLGYKHTTFLDKDPLVQKHILFLFWKGGGRREESHGLNSRNTVGHINISAKRPTRQYRSKKNF